MTLTNSVVGNEYLKAVMNNIDPYVRGSDLTEAQTENATTQVIQLINVSSPDREQISQLLMFVGFELVGKKARNISESKYCYIATDIYGDYNHPNVKIFRNFRDQFLEKSILGKMFIKIYYKLSPFFIRTKFYNSVLKSPIRKILDIFAKVLKIN